ncbi:protein kinase domain-containing protein [Nannocystis radixulma]|uniref:ATP-binding cassette domain-containing protein n=1 Tax=Nannocystis radixulma TaxID=2995305 RepID=A0ABT5BES3_9BACT|nr:ATP-binding cassette domain-containing protein [Nannocystis radixulma]MDC0672213.1 ATP-binding cassette domain-containing protein [Nannocystis radixulma]
MLDADEVESFTYYTMAYVEGETLAEMVRARGRLPLAEVVRILREVCWALAYSHACGVIHRDVKPENILIDRASRRALVSDFGIAHRVGSPHATEDDQIVGTPLYMSPEQATSGEIDGRSDLYSLGVVGFWLLAGQHPFPPQAAHALLQQHASRPAPAVRALAPELPLAVAAVIDRCLAKRPEDRFQSCEELAAALDGALAGRAPESAETRPLSEAEIAGALTQAAELRRSLNAASSAGCERLVAGALAERRSGRGAVEVAVFQRLALVRPAATEDIRVWAAAHGHLLPDQQRAAAVDLLALFERQEDKRLVDVLLALAAGLPLHHPQVHALHVAAARLRCHRESGLDAREDGAAAARVQQELCDLAARLVDLRTGEATPSAPTDDNPIVALHQEIAARLRENDGTRATKRLLDLAKLLDVQRARLAAIAALGERVAEHRNRQIVRVADEAWFALLREIMEHASGLLRSASDESTIAGQTSDLHRGDLAAARRKFMAYRGQAGAAPTGVTVHCSDLGKSFRARLTAETAVLWGVSLELRPGTITGVVGPNGCGKTTLLRIVGGQLAPSHGRLAYPQLDAASAAGKAPDWPKIVPQIGYVAQRPARWFGRLADNLHRWAALHGVVGEENETEVEFYLHRLGLARHRNAGWSELSGGYRTRFELARVMVARPRLLILDEPLAPLDINSQETFLNDLRDMADMEGCQIPILLSSQHILEVESVADTVLCLDSAGRPRFHGPARAIAGAADDRTFELDGALPAALLESLRHQVPLRAAYRSGERWIVRMAADIPRDRLIRAVLARTGALEYFRDITHSCLKFFRSDES